MRRRRLFAALLVLTLLGAGLVGLAGGAEATRPYPGRGDVARARRHAAHAAHDVASMQKQLDAASARAGAAEDALSAAAEDYDVARIRLRAARQEAATSQQAADHARSQLGRAQVQVGQLAAATYREGGPIADLGVLLSPGGPDAVLERATIIQSVASERQRAVHSFDSARVTANALQQQANLALARQQQAAAQMAAAKAAAEARAAQARATVAAATRTENTLVKRLATARRTSVRLERARQAGLAEAARERAERAAARAAAARAAAARAAAGRQHQGGAPSSDPVPGPDPSPGSGSSSGSASGGDAAVAWARGRIGLPYQWGGAGPGSYDCSGLTMRAWQHAGVYLPHSSRMQYQQVRKVSYGELRPGDLIFYATDPGDPGTIHHVTLYAGGGMMIEAPYTGADVRYVPLRRGDSMPYAGRP